MQSIPVSVRSQMWTVGIRNTHVVVMLQPQMMEVVRMHDVTSSDWQNWVGTLFIEAGAGLVLGLGPTQRRLLRHHLLALQGEAALLAVAKPELAVPLVTFQGYLETMVPTPGAIGRRTRCHR